MDLNLLTIRDPERLYEHCEPVDMRHAVFKADRVSLVDTAAPLLWLTDTVLTTKASSHPTASCPIISTVSVNH